jgi:hypothetical protein
MRKTDDRLPDLARPGRARYHRGPGVRIVSADIVQFIPRPRRNRVSAIFPSVVLKLEKPVGDLVMDHADVVPDESKASSPQCEAERDRS